MPSNKAPGFDKVPLFVVKDCLAQTLPAITNIINSSLANSIFPRAWKRGEVVAHLKDGDHEVPNNNRPISLLPVFSKVVERIALCQFNNYLIKNNCLTSHQSGNRKFHSTGTLSLLVLDLKLEHYNWNLAFTQISKICKENKLREFNYKFLHRIIVTKKELYAYAIETDSKRVYCSEPDSILHSFTECEESRSFFDKVISWFNTTNNSQYSPTIVQQLFGMTHDGNDKKLSRFNYCLLFAKYFLYCQKLSLKKCNFHEFIKKLHLKFHCENLL